MTNIRKAEAAGFKVFSTLVVCPSVRVLLSLRQAYFSKIPFFSQDTLHQQDFPNSIQ
jgi:hypothetical protein